MKKIYLFSSLILIIALGLFLSPVLAKNNKISDEQVLPEEDGIYDVANNPHLKLRVIVHHAKPAKPGPTLVLSCNLPDPDSEAVVASTTWKMPSVWTYRLNPSSVPALVNGANLPTIAANAFSVWTNAISGQVSMNRGDNTSANRANRDNQNIIAWGRTSGTALATTYIWYDTSTKPYTTVELDTIMNQKFSWAWSDPTVWVTSTDTTCAYGGVYDAQDIMTHEIGHWYGLDDEYASDYSYNTMYGYGSKGQTNANTLTTGDIRGVQSIYLLLR